MALGFALRTRTGVASWDRVSMEKSDGQFFNGGFEEMFGEQPIGWGTRPEGATVIKPTDSEYSSHSADGGNYLKISGNDTSISQSVKRISQNERYIVSFWHKSTVDNMISSYFNNASGSGQSEATVGSANNIEIPSTGGVWKRVSILYNKVPAERYSFGLQLRNRSATEISYWDEFEIKKYTEMFAGGDFESEILIGFSGFTFANGATKATDEKYAGRYSAKTEKVEGGSWGHISYNHSSVDATKKYAMSFYYKSDVTAQVQFMNQSWGSDYRYSLPAVETWTKCSIFFEKPSGFTGMAWYFRATEVGTAYFDDIRLWVDDRSVFDYLKDFSASDSHNGSRFELGTPADELSTGNITARYHYVPTSEDAEATVISALYDLQTNAEVLLDVAVQSKSTDAGAALDFEVLINLESVDGNKKIKTFFFNNPEVLTPIRGCEILE